MLKEHSRVVLKKAMPKLGLQPGAVGVVVNVYKNGEAYEVEFMSKDGRTIGLETLPALDVRAAKVSAITHENDRLSA